MITGIVSSIFLMSLSTSTPFIRGMLMSSRTRSGRPRSTAVSASVPSAAEHDGPIPYIQRTREYYLRLGYPAYRWAHFDEVPFTPLAQPLAQSRLALITTAAPYQAGVGDQGPGAPYNAAAKFYRVYSDSSDAPPDLRIAHVG